MNFEQLQRTLETEDLTTAEPVYVATLFLELIRYAHDGTYDSVYRDFIKPKLTELKTLIPTKIDEFTTIQDEIHKEA